MRRRLTWQQGFSRRDFSLTMGLFVLQWAIPAAARAAEPSSLDERFDFLSKHGNSTCSAAFTESVASMPVAARLQGSFCAPMNRHRYGEQVNALKKYAAIAEIPPDPYDITAGTAQKVMRFYDLALFLTRSEPTNVRWTIRTSGDRAAASTGAGGSMAAWGGSSSASIASPASIWLTSGICRAAAVAAPSTVTAEKEVLDRMARSEAIRRLSKDSVGDGRLPFVISS